MLQAPDIDSRTAAILAHQTRQLLALYLPGVQDRGEKGQPLEALIEIFARYGEIVIDRLNRAPEKNFLAFLDLIGVTPQPARAARVPITFFLSAPNVASAVVPAGTQVAAELAKGETKPVLFETQHELVVVAVNLDAVFLKDGASDQYLDFRSAIAPQKPPETGQVAVATPDAALASATAAGIALPHLMYFAFDPMASLPAHNELRLHFSMNAGHDGNADERSVQWELPLPQGSPLLSDAPPSGLIITPASDTTRGLSTSGELVFRNVPFPLDLCLRGTLGRWLAVRLLTPITPGFEPVHGMVRASQLPQVSEFSAELAFEEADLLIDAALSNNAPLDCSKDFLPFGERPKFGDTFYISSKAFANGICEAGLSIELANPAGSAAATPVPPVTANGTRLLWDFWDGQRWQPLGTSQAGQEPPPSTSRVRFRNDDVAPPAAGQFSDGTQALSRSGTVTFSFNGQQAAGKINGQLGTWIRVRIIAGDYGKEMYYETDHHSGKVLITPATFAPPVIHSVKVQYKVARSWAPGSLLTCNDFTWQSFSDQQAFSPFVPVPDDDVLPAVYFGFTLPEVAEKAESLLLPGGAIKPPFAPRALSLYLHLDETPRAATPASSNNDSAQLAKWEYWNGAIWNKWPVRDDTEGLTRSGLLGLLPPLDYQRKSEFARNCYWLRLRQSRRDFRPRLQGVLMNTTMAEQGTTLRNEILGSGNGRPGQTFLTIQSPVLAGQQLDVAEPIAPPQAEEQRIREDEGDEAIRRIVTGGREQIWVRWHEVANFQGSSPRDRHYMLNRQTGEVRFGDAVNGLIPPALTGNIRMAKYRTGGGAAGNKPAFAISQVKTAIPYVSKAVNWLPADGGGDAETNDGVMDRGPRTLRHGHRAVALEDFEDLAVESSGEVARAKCVPLYDLEADPGAGIRKPGTVSIIVAPRSADAMPQPGTQLLALTRDFLLSAAQATVNVVVVGPEYTAIDVSVEIVVVDLDLTRVVELGVIDAISRFLHPVTGNRDGKGWDFGRMPQKSEIYGVIEDVGGVNHARNLALRLRPSRPGVGNANRSLACCGKLNVVTTLQGPAVSQRR